MIDLRITLQEMRAAIGVSDPSRVHALTDALTPEFYTAPHLHVDLAGHARDDLFPILKVSLAQRFPSIPPVQLTRDLLAPLKNGLGNAYKRGNARDRAKSIAVAIDLTPHGAVIAITDEGAGFDVEHTLQRYRSQEQYFQNYGAGFRIFDQSGSLVSYADGGRTFLLCFRVDDAAAATAPPAAAMPDADLRERLRAALTGSGSALAARLCQLASSARSIADGLRIEDLHLFAPTVHDAAVRCAVRCRVDSEVVTTVLAGLRFDSPAAARRDFDLGRALHARVESKKVRLPQPIVCLDGDHLVFSAFDPWMDLWTYVGQRGEAASLLRLGERLGACLRVLHHAPAVDIGVPAVEDWPAVVAGWKRTGASAVRAVDAALPERRDDAGRLVEALIERAGRMVPPAPLLIHGKFGGDTAHYGVDGRFYLTRFDGCRRSHPGLDVGSALADLFLLARSPILVSSRPTDSDLHDAFMRAYLMDDAIDWKAEIPTFVLAALLSRLATSPTWERSDGVATLDLCHRALGESR